MMNEEKPRRKSIRLKGYDYSQPGAYFVTICTKDREHLFGEIRNGEMEENIFAGVVRQCWNELPRHYPNIELDAFVVMPNHVHGIIMINVGARHASPLWGKQNTLGDIVGSFKSAITKHINQQRNTPGQSIWQRGYHDHITRSEQSLNRIREYILTNPLQWEYDKENQEQIGSDTFDQWSELEGNKLHQYKKDQRGEISITKR